MCWGVPAKVIEISGIKARVDFGGGAVKTVLVATSDVRKGDVVLIHAGTIIGKISLDEALQIVDALGELELESMLDIGIPLDEAERIISAKKRAFLETAGVGE